MSRFLLLRSIGARGMGVALLAFWCAQRVEGQDPIRILEAIHTQDGLIRAYDVYLAAESSPKRRPLLLVFHGGGSDKDAMPSITCPTGSEQDPGCLNRLAALGPEEYIVVYPQGVFDTWNAGNCCGIAMASDIDDVGFVAQLLDRLQADYDFDPQRIYATGISNGAMLTHRLACELSDSITAIAPVSGGIGIPDADCRPTRPVAVLEFHGTADENYPYGGGVGSGVSNTDFVGIPETIAGWVQRDGCSGDFSETRLPDAQPEDGTTVFQDEYGDCSGKARIVLDRIESGGHTWPDGSPRLAAAGLGVVSRDLNANEAMLQFFSEQSLARKPPILPEKRQRTLRRVVR